MTYNPYNTGWKLAYKNAAGRIWRFIENNLMISKNHLKKVRKGKFKPTPYKIDFKDWYKGDNV